MKKTTHVIFNAFGILWHAEGSYHPGYPRTAEDDGYDPYFDDDVNIYAEEYAEDTWLRVSGRTALYEVLSQNGKDILFELACRALSEQVE